MYMVGYNVYLLRKCPYHKILSDEFPNRMAEFISIVGAESMEPNSTMGAHDNHRINDECHEKPNAEILDKEHEEERHHAHNH